MIDKEVFAQGMGLLAGNYGREVDGAVARSWYEILSSRLDNQQFIAAIQRTMVEHKEFWPSVGIILEKAGADDETRAQSAWRHLTDTLGNHGGYRFMPHEVYQSFDDATKAGIKAAGGLAEITNCSEQRWPSLVKKFCKAYTDALTPIPALSGATGDPEVRRLVARTSRDMALPRGDRE